MSHAGVDPGLQPERTTLSWGRTMLAVLVLGTAFLRWLGTFGAAALLPTAMAVFMVLAIQLTQRRRYRSASRGIASSHGSADLAGVLLLGGGIVAMSLLEVGAILLH